MRRYRIRKFKDGNGQAHYKVMESWRLFWLIPVWSYCEVTSLLAYPGSSWDFECKTFREALAHKRKCENSDRAKQRKAITYATR